MPSIREQILVALETTLQGIGGPSVERDAALPMKVPAGGLVVLRDNGDVPRADFAGADQYDLTVTVEVLHDSADTTTTVDALRTQVIATLMADRTVGGLAVDLRRGPASELDPLHVEGAAPWSAVSLAFTILYWTAEGDPERLAP
jgi:hypothetical protein